MSTIMFDDVSLRIPPWVVDHATFRRWLHSDSFPEKGRVCYLAGEVWVDMSKEQLYTHNQVKQEFNRVLGNLLREQVLGTWFPDGILISSAEADFTSGPDGCFISTEALETGRVRELPGARDGYLELEGALDLVLEVVSDSSVEKDTVLLPRLYWEAGITEYWLVDARTEQLRFDILRHGAKGYTTVRRQGGWVKSSVLGKAFQLAQEQNARGNPVYTLSVR